jgi:hypothetical protein
MEDCPRIALELSPEDTELLLSYLVSTGTVTLSGLRLLSYEELRELMRAHYRDALRANLRTSGKVSSRSIQIGDAESKRRQAELMRRLLSQFQQTTPAPRKKSTPKP